MLKVIVIYFKGNKGERIFSEPSILLQNHKLHFLDDYFVNFCVSPVWIFPFVDGPYNSERAHWGKDTPDNARTLNELGVLYYLPESPRVSTILFHIENRYSFHLLHLSSQARKNWQNFFHVWYLTDMATFNKDHDNFSTVFFHIVYLVTKIFCSFLSILCL